MTWSWFCDPTLLLHGFRPSEAVLSKQPLVLNTVKAGRITTQSAEFSWTSNLELHIFEQVHSYKSGVWKELIERFSSWLLGSSHNGFRPVEEAPSDSNLETSGGLQGSDWLESITERKELEVYVCVFGFIGRSNVQVFAMWKVYTTMSSRISILEILERIEVLELIAVFLWRVCGAHWGWRLWKLYVFRNFRV